MPNFLRVPYVDFPGQFRSERKKLMRAVTRVFAHGKYILGPEVAAFEKRFAGFCGVRHAVGVGNGTDALILVLRALGIGPGHEVITAPNSFIATAGAIAAVGARPVFVDVGEDLLMDPDRIGRAITSRTRAILPVHLGGICADMEAIAKIARRRRLWVIEDASQSAGARVGGHRAGSLGAAGCFSLHPLKNLNAAGDAGVVTTNDTALAAKIRLLRNHGLRSRDDSVCWGVNSRLDSIQAAIVSARLGGLSATIRRRRAIARRYVQKIYRWVACPRDGRGRSHTYHLFVIQCDRRDELAEFLKSRGIETKIHYPTPIHLQPCARSLGYRAGDFPVCERLSRRILSLPVHPHLSAAQVDWVCDSIEAFYSSSGS